MRARECWAAWVHGLGGLPFACMAVDTASLTRCEHVNAGLHGCMGWVHGLQFVWRLTPRVLQDARVQFFSGARRCGLVIKDFPNR